MRTKVTLAMAGLAAVVLAGCAGHPTTHATSADLRASASSSPTAAGTSAPSATSAATSAGGTSKPSSTTSSTGAGSSTSSHGSNPTGPKGSGTAAPLPPVNHACPARTTGLSGGKWRQAIYLQSLGSHEFPRELVRVRACSSSGLPVTLALARNNNCVLHGVDLDAVDPPASCDVVASQRGDSRFAAASTVSSSYRAIRQQIVGSWGGPAAGTSFSLGSTGVLTVTVVVTSASSFDESGLGVTGADSSVCGFWQFDSFSGSGTVRKTVEISLAGVGKCTLRMSMGGAALNQQIIAAPDITYYVTS
jgi:hypothetical protein